MATVTQTKDSPTFNRTRLLLWLTAVGVLTTLLAFLTVAIRDNPVPTQDVEVYDWISGWDAPGLGRLFTVVSFLTNNWPGLVLGLAGVVFFWLLGLSREAKAFAVIGAVLGGVIFLGDAVLGEWVGRSRPIDAGTTHPSFPSGHVFGSTVLFGFWLFLAGYYGLKKKLLVAGAVLLVAFLLAVGASRIYLHDHWPSDVAAGYLLGGIWLLVLIPLFLYLRRAPWFFRLSMVQDPTVVACETCRVEKSIASVVVLNPDEGTATKAYKPPPLVDILYWIAFQAKFPYTSNTTALEAASYRRRIASLLTLHRFGKDLVAPATAVTCEHGNCSFVTEYVPGSKVDNDADAQRFLGQVTELFAEAGLGVWQVNPRNPHAHTNLIKTPAGDYKIIDLESAVVTLLPARGQLRSALRNGNIPIFDDIDFIRLRAYISGNHGSLSATLGSNGLAELSDVTEKAELLIRTWKESEPRILGRLISRVYRLLDVKGVCQHLMGSVKGADAVAIAFLKNGIDRWEKDGTIGAAQAESLRRYIATGAVNNAVHHLGVHMVLSVAIAVPIPGLRSAARFLWTLLFWGKHQLRRLFRRSGSLELSAENIHNPLVMAIALVPGFGAVAYLAARPLRHKLLVRLMLDQSAWKLPFKLYHRLHLARWLTPAFSTDTTAPVAVARLPRVQPKAQDPAIAPPKR